MGESVLNTLMEKVLKSRRRVWFGTCWKPQGDKYKGSPIYDSLGDYLRAFETKHAGCRWAYAIHEKGHNIDVYPHEQCEHKHFVIQMDNNTTGSAMLKFFQGCHVEPAKYGVENCGRYLLHLTVTSLGKERISADNLYCSGEGEHGKVWFPLITSQVYEQFNVNSVLHYVFNDHMHHMIQFISRFGGSVAHGAYLSAIKEALQIWGKNDFDNAMIGEVFENLDSDKKTEIIQQVLHCRLDVALKSDWFTIRDLDLKNFPFAYHFVQLYIWLHCTEVPANHELSYLISMYQIKSFDELNKKRLDLLSVIERNSIFEKDLVEFDEFKVC